MKKEKLLIVVTGLAQYRIPVFNEIGNNYDIHIVYSEVTPLIGNGKTRIDEMNINQYLSVPCYSFFCGKLFYQSGLIRYIKKTSPNKVFACAHSHYISYWILLLYCYFHAIPIYSHMQGPYNKSSSLLCSCMYFVIARLSTKTLLYTQSSLEKLNSFKLGIVNNGKREARFIVIYNSIVNHFPVLPEEKDYSKKGILFLGRLRKGCDLDLLCETVITLRKENYPVDVHVVGTGELDDFYRKIFGEYEGINFYGEIYDQERIAEISRNCSIGCYPGNAGLSIVHYMSLSLACLVHDNLMQHQGPEPSYMEDTIHGRMFLYGNKESFKQVLREMIEISDLRLYGKNAYLCYTTLSQPSYAQRIMAALK